MSANSSIEWTDRTWNPVRGCSVVSPGCHNCYAMKQAHRFSGKGKAYEGLTKQTKAGPQWTGKIEEIAHALNEPHRWKKPSRVFVNSMSDLFHEGVSDAFIDAVWAVMSMTPRHTYQILTKRPERMCELVPQLAERNRPADGSRWPLPNVWLGVSVENKHFMSRIEDVRATPAAVHFLSLEPLLEDLGAVDLRGIDWVIVGGESGNGSRPFDIAWARSIVKQCADAKVACFVKQLGAVAYQRDDEFGTEGIFDPYKVSILHTTDRKGGDMAEWPIDLRVRQYPAVSA